MDLQTGIAGGDKRASGSFVFLFLRVLTWGSLNGAGRSIVQHGRGLDSIRSVRDIDVVALGQKIHLV